MNWSTIHSNLPNGRDDSVAKHEHVDRKTQHDVDDETNETVSQSNRHAHQEETKQSSKS
jgi:hypothetical protein